MNRNSHRVRHIWTLICLIIGICSPIRLFALEKPDEDVISTCSLPFPAGGADVDPYRDMQGDSPISFYHNCYPTSNCCLHCTIRELCACACDFVDERLVRDDKILLQYLEWIKSKDGVLSEGLKKLVCEIPSYTVTILTLQQSTTDRALRAIEVQSTFTLMQVGITICLIKSAFERLKEIASRGIFWKKRWLRYEAKYAFYITHVQNVSDVYEKIKSSKNAVSLWDEHAPALIAKTQKLITEYFALEKKLFAA